MYENKTHKRRNVFMSIFNLFKDKKPEEPKSKVSPSNDYDENLPFFIDTPTDENLQDTEPSVHSEIIQNENDENNKVENTEDGKKTYDREGYRKRTVSVRFRMTPEEKEKLDAAYKASGAKNLQEYLLAAALNGPILPKGTIEQYESIMSKQEEILRQVSGMANNINQLAKYANTKKQAGNLSDLKIIVGEMRNLYNTSAISNIKAIKKYMKVR